MKIPTNRTIATKSILGALLVMSILGCHARPDEKENDGAKIEEKTASAETAEADEKKTSDPTAEADKREGENASEENSKEKKVFHAFEVNPNEPCDHCEQRFCTKLNGKNFFDLCYNGESGEDCRAVVACATKSKCGAKQAAQCYCGDNATISECMAKGGDGPCKAEIEVASQSKDPSIIAVRYADPAYPVGRAMALIDCRRSYCPKCNE